MEGMRKCKIKFWHMVWIVLVVLLAAFLLWPRTILSVLQESASINYSEIMRDDVERLVGVVIAGQELSPLLEWMGQSNIYFAGGRPCAILRESGSILYSCSFYERSEVNSRVLEMDLTIHSNGDIFNNGIRHCVIGGIEEGLSILEGYFTEMEESC